MDVVLNEDIVSLEEVDVMGYGSRMKDEISDQYRVNWLDFQSKVK